MKYPKTCFQGKKKLNFDDCQLAILRTMVDEVQERTGKEMIHSPEIKQIINIIETFLVKRKRICYGGTAINNILPEEFQFYQKDLELPDYDFFSPTAAKDAKDLADIYFKAGFTEVEAKSGVHGGTYKVFVNFIPVADITSLPNELYRTLTKNAIIVNGIYYAPPDYLRMAMYLELSRPKGDTSRWEKVLKRLILLNKVYPLKGKKCSDIEVQRMFDDPIRHLESSIFTVVRDALINQGVVFFGGFANRMYLQYHPFFRNKELKKIPDFDVLAKDPKRVSQIIKENLQRAGFKGIRIKKRPATGEIVPLSYEVKLDNETLVSIYKPLGCHSYNVVHRFDRKIRIATIDTMLSLYLAFLYVNKPYYDPQRLLCMCEYLFQVQKHNQLAQKGILRRFSIDCYGKQMTLQDMRKHKADMYKKLKSKRGSPEWEIYFLRYVPADIKKKQTRKKKKRKKRRKKRRTRRNIFKKALTNLL